ncbi:hypothetical protein ETD85_58460, partial [Nonomuraea zeae]
GSRSGPRPDPRPGPRPDCRPAPGRPGALGSGPRPLGPGLVRHAARPPDPAGEGKMDRSRKGKP